MVAGKKSGWAERSFLISAVFTVFGYGVAVGHFELFPFPILEFGWSSARQVARERGTLMGTRPTEFLVPARHAGTGLTTFRPGEAAPGLTLLSGFFEGGNEIRLLRLDGSVVNRWPVKFYDHFPTTGHIQPDSDVPRSNWNTAVHGSQLLPDGSVVFNFTYKGTVKLDRCGRQQWTLNRMTHHSVSRSADGTLWIPDARHVRTDSPFASLRPPYLEDVLLQVSEDGRILREISIVDVLFRNNLQGVLFWKRGTGDFTHLNDVEELSPELAARFPAFAPGDLLLSMRMPHLVLVLDPATLVVKWFQVGPWIGQHDPDFLPSGRILVFNNNDDGRAGTVYGGSNIIEVEPATHAVTYRYGLAPGQSMFTEGRGKVQELDGHLLVTEANAGRAFEVDAGGEVVWEFVNRYDEKDAAVITEATRYPEDYFHVRDWSCAAAPSR